MNIRLHNSAQPTPALRLEIQQVTGNNYELAEHFRSCAVCAGRLSQTWPGGSHRTGLGSQGQVYTLDLHAAA